MERYLQRQQQAQPASSSSARSDLDVANRQSLPVGVNTDAEREEVDFEDDPEFILADDAKHLLSQGSIKKLLVINQNHKMAR